jgi:hypothetical protein
MATAAIDFAEQKQTEVEPYKDSPTENELSTMEDYGTILKPYFDAQENLEDFPLNDMQRRACTSVKTSQRKKFANVLVSRVYLLSVLELTTNGRYLWRT